MHGASNANFFSRRRITVFFPGAHRCTLPVKQCQLFLYSTCMGRSWIIKETNHGVSSQERGM